jgi:hypothetical protein
MTDLEPKPTPVASIRKAWVIMADNAPEVAAELAKLALTAEHEQVRARAGIAIMSRVGLHERIEVEFRYQDADSLPEAMATGSPVDIVKMRLAQLKTKKLPAFPQTVDADLEPSTVGFDDQ